MLLCPKPTRLERSVKEVIVILDPKGQDMKAFEIEIEWNSIIRDVAIRILKVVSQAKEFTPTINPIIFLVQFSKERLLLFQSI